MNQYLKAYKDPNSYASLGQNISFKLIENSKKVNTVTKAIEKGYIKKANFERFLQKYGFDTADKQGNDYVDICLHLPLKKPIVGSYTDTFICVYMTKKMIDE